MTDIANHSVFIHRRSRNEDIKEIHDLTSEDAFRTAMDHLYDDQNNMVPDMVLEIRNPDGVVFTATNPRIVPPATAS